MSAEPAERVWEKHAWILLFLASAIMLPPSIGSLVSDAPPFAIYGSSEGRAAWAEVVSRYPNLAENFMTNLRLSGATGVGFAVFGMTISVFSYRKGERWAWYALWVVVGVYVLLAVHALGGGTSGAPFLYPIFPLLGLLLPIRRFFPKQEIAARG